MMALRQPTRRCDLGIKLEVGDSESVRQVFQKLMGLKRYWGPRYHRHRRPYYLKPSQKRRNKKGNSSLTKRRSQYLQCQRADGTFEVFVILHGSMTIAYAEIRKRLQFVLGEFGRPWISPLRSLFVSKNAGRIEFDVLTDDPWKLCKRLQPFLAELGMSESADLSYCKFGADQVEPLLPRFHDWSREA